MVAAPRIEIKCINCDSTPTFRDTIWSGGLQHLFQRIDQFEDWCAIWSDEALNNSAR